MLPQRMVIREILIVTHNPLKRNGRVASIISIMRVFLPIFAERNLRLAT